MAKTNVYLSEFEMTDPEFNEFFGQFACSEVTGELNCINEVCTN